MTTQEILNLGYERMGFWKKDIPTEDKDLLREFAIQLVFNVEPTYTAYGNPPKIEFKVKELHSFYYMGKRRRSRFITLDVNDCAFYICEGDDESSITFSLK